MPPSNLEGLTGMGVHPTTVRNIGRFCRSANITKYHKDEARKHFVEALGELVQRDIDTALIELFDYDKNYSKPSDFQTPGVVFKAIQDEPVTSWGTTLRKSRHDFAYYNTDLKLKVDKISDMLPEINDNWGAIPEDVRRELVTLLFPEFTRILKLKNGDKIHYSGLEFQIRSGHHRVVTGTLNRVNINLVESENITDVPVLTYKPIITLYVEGENGVNQVISIDNDKKVLNIKVANLEQPLP